MRFIATYLLLLAIAASLNANPLLRYNYNWYFGSQTAITFSTPDGSPSPVSGSKMATHEGCTSVSTPAGTMLFYTNGLYVWNHRHEIMHNGSGLYGSTSSTSSAIAILKPGTNHHYILFTIGDINQGSSHPRLYYHDIDITNDFGRGAVWNKNLFLQSNMTEKLAGMFVDCNTAWVVARAKNGSFYSYKINDEGLQLTPKVSSVDNGVDHSCDICPVGEMKFSPLANYLASISLHKNANNKFVQIIEIFEFNAIDASITELYTLEFSASYIDGYTLEFSPDEKKIYFERNGAIVQINLEYASKEAIEGSIKEVRPISPFFVRNALKLGPDDKIYFADRIGNEYRIISIDNPNADVSSLSISTAIASINLFNHNKFPTTPVVPKFKDELVDPTIKVQNSCFGSISKIYSDVPSGNYSFIWEKPNGNIVTGRDLILYQTDESDNGWYKLSVTDHDNCKVVTDSVEVILKELPDIVIEAEKKMFCRGDSVKLTSKNVHTSYRWSNGDTTQSTYVHSEGVWSLTATNEHGCENQELIYLGFYDSPRAKITVDRVYKCKGDYVTLRAKPIEKQGTYLWSTGDTGTSISVRDPGTYYLEVTGKEGCTDRDEVQVMDYEVPAIAIGGEKTICKGNKSQLTVTGQFKSFLWSTGETTKIISINKAGSYWVRATSHEGCYAYDTISVNYYKDAEFEIIGRKIICEGSAVTLEVSPDFRHYRWSTGETTKSITVSQVGTYWVEVTADNDCITRKEFELIAGKDMQVDILPSDSSACIGETIVLTAYPQGQYDYLWSTGETTSTIEVSQNGTYSVIVSVEGACKSEGSIDIKFHDIMPLEIVSDGEIICYQSSVTLVAGAEYSRYLWNTGDTTQSIRTSQPGLYTLLVENEFGCKDTASIELESADEISAQIIPGGNIELCEGDTLTLKAFPDGDYNYQWSTGETSAGITVSEPGSYYLIVSIGTDCRDTTYAEVQLITAPPLIISAESDLICDSSTLALSASEGFASYLWSTGETQQKIIVSQAGIYNVTGISAEGCIAEANISIKSADAALTFLSNNTFDLDSLHIGESSSASVTFLNNSSEITDISINIDNPNISVSPADKQLTLMPQETGEISLTYARTEPQTLSDQIKISVNKPCKKDYSLPVSGHSFAITLFSMRSHTLDVGMDFCLPVFAEIIKKGSPSLSYPFTLTIKYESSAFQFKSASTGELIENKIIDGMRILTLQFTDLDLSAEQKIITEICGEVLIGKDIETRVSPSEAKWQREQIYSDYSPGAIFAFTCEPGMNQIDILNPSKVEVSPNPASGQLLVKIETEEIGQISLQIINSRGETVELHEISSDGSLLRRSYTFDTAALGSGVYFVTLTTPTSMISKPVVIKK